MPKVATRPAPFRGFDRTAPQFFHELAAEMSRDWFVANKARYEALWVEPLTALLAEVGARIANERGDTTRQRRVATGAASSHCACRPRATNCVPT
jgi:uncharacterized protein (DUF2461 family)